MFLSFVIMQLTVAEAKEICPYAWMKEALDELVSRQTNSI